ncbi:MAG: hypothetical protein FWD56_07960 [Bacteroidales bacterium]|nr:hypothetical protein [Bacteroidales bacterium]
MRFQTCLTQQPINHIYLSYSSNCYATGAVSGTSSVGGVAGVNDGSINNCVALNQSISASGFAGRVIGTNSGTRTNNAAWVNMLVRGATVSGAAGDKNGADMTLIEISSGDGTLGGRFSAPDWVITAGKLPVLSSSQNSDIPAHIL